MNIRIGWPCRRPFVGFEHEKLICGHAYRLILWPERWGIYFAWYRD